MRRLDRYIASSVVVAILAVLGIVVGFMARFVIIPWNPNRRVREVGPVNHVLREVS